MASVCARRMLGAGGGLFFEGLVRIMVVRCEKCLPGYWAFPECRECDCQQSGTVDDVCDERSAKCMCKKNVLGPRCDQCRPGTFDLRKSDPDGCSECFCFRVTDRCRSSNWPIRSLRVADNDWRVDDQNGTVRVDEESRVIYEAAEANPSQSVYFEVDLQPGVDYSRMYGLHLSFAISSFPSGDRPKPNVKADVRLVSFWMNGRQCKAKTIEDCRQHPTRALGQRAASKCQPSVQCCRHAVPRVLASRKHRRACQPCAADADTAAIAANSSEGVLL